jgi:hypothetical protein
MKRFWLVLFSLGLIATFSASAFAVDVKVGADYYIGGLYLNKTSVADVSDAPNPSTAFFYQDLRVGADFIISPSLKLVTQFDAMERIWGGVRSVSDVADGNGPGTRAEAENIAFRRVYIDYTSPVGLFKVGYMDDYVFGTIFADRGTGPTVGQIQYYIQQGPFTGFIGYAKEEDNSYSYNASVTGISATRTDRDLDSYRIAGIYNFKNGEAGALFLWNRDATNRGMASGSYLSNAYVIDPYVKAKIGPVDLQAEVQYWFGDAAKYEGYVTNATNVSINALSVFVDATVTFGQFYAGGSFAYLSGDDPSTSDKVEGGINTAGIDWSPCLILFNQDLNYWAGILYGNHNSVLDNEISNAWFFQGRIGVKPASKWDIMLAVSYAIADKKPDPFKPSDQPSRFSYPGDTYGTEIDLTATYNITDNLNYMLGIGYLFTGDYFKGYDGVLGPNTKVVDDYILINKLSLSF